MAEENSISLDRIKQTLVVCGVLLVLLVLGPATLSLAPPPPP